MKTAWILTRAINEYNQDGDYFVAWFSEQPTIDQLRALTQRPDEYLEHLLKGGGRLNWEEEWYYLKGIKEEV